VASHSKRSLTEKTPSQRAAQRSSLEVRSLAIRCLPPLFVIVLTIPPFLPILRNEFVNWDDLFNLVDNREYRGLGWAELKWMFTTFHLSLYRPVTWMTLGLDYWVWGMDPFGYHLTSIIFHGLNALLFYFIALRLLRLALPAMESSDITLRAGAAFAALIFSLHPLRVEAVAWASARNDVVSAFLILLAFYCYLQAAAAPAITLRRNGWMIAALLTYGVSLLAKGIGMTLPLVFLVTDIYPLKRLEPDLRKWLEPVSRRLLWEKLPFLLLAIGAGIVAVLAKLEGQVVHGFDKHGWLVRIAESFFGLAFYLWKTLWPFALSPLYQRPSQPSPLDIPFIASAMVVFGVSAAVVILRRRWPSGLASWICYAVILIPVLGIVQFGPQVVADRYSYVSCLVWAVVAGGAVVYLFGAVKAPRANEARSAAIVVVAFAVLTGLGFLTWQQTRVWRDSERLWRHVLTINPATSYAYNNLASELNRQGKTAEAIGLYRQAVDLDGQFALAHHNLGDALAKQGQFEAAIESYQKALAIDAKSILSRHHLANTLAKAGRRAAALEHYFKALQIAPKEAALHNDLGNVLAAQGDLEKAMQHYRRAAELDSRASEPYFNLANLMVRQEQWEQAKSYFQLALKTNPHYPEAHHNLGRLLASQGRLEEAVGHFREAVRIEPRFAAAHESLILALSEQGKKEEAMQHYQRAREILSGREPGRLR